MTTTAKSDLKHINAMHIDRKDVMGMAGAKLETLLDGNGYSAGKVVALAKSLATRTKTAQADIHAAAVAAIYISLPTAEGGNNNAEPARQLLASMGTGWRTKTLADWFAAFSNIRLTVKDGEWTAKMVKHGTDAYKTASPLKAFDKPFWTVEEQTKGAQAFDLSAAMARLLQRATNDDKLSDDDKAKVALLGGWARKHKLVDAENKPIKVIAA